MLLEWRPVPITPMAGLSTRRRSPLVLALAAAGVTLASRVPFRSEALFSWDAANFALAMERIDIAAHRPHPPGYLGYVMAGRVLNVVLHDANAALVAWNLIVSALAVAVIVFFASSLERQRSLMPVAAGAVLAPSPLLWFYGEVGEIYPTEMLAVLLIAWSAWIVVIPDAGPSRCSGRPTRSGYVP